MPPPGVHKGGRQYMEPERVSREAPGIRAHQRMTFLLLFRQRDLE